MRKTFEGRNGKNGESARQLMARMQAALEEVDRAGPLHNPEFAGAVYQHIVKLTTGTGKPQMNTDERGAAQPQPQNPPRRRKERKVFEIAFLRVLRVFAVKMSLIAGSGGFTSSCANQTAFAAWAHNQTRTRPLPGW